LKFIKKHTLRLLKAGKIDDGKKDIVPSNFLEAK